jgi:hypothetical protein
MPVAAFPLDVASPAALHAAVDSATITPSDTAPLRSVKASATDRNGIFLEALNVGTGGNAVTLTTVLPANESANISVAVAGNDTTVTLAATGTPATLELQGMRFESVTKGTGGNSTRVAFVDPGTPNATASVSVAGSDITVNLATGAGSHARLTNQGMTYTSKSFGTGGNAISIALVNPGTPNAPVSIGVVGNAITANLATGPGVAQVETATAAGTVTGNGNASVVVTGAGITGSPITLAVAVLNGDTPTLWAAKVRAALAATAAITALYAVGGTGADITLTELVPNGNDATLNIALATGTATGITAAPTSANTTAGVAPALTTTRQQLYNAIVASAAASALISVNFSSGEDTVLAALSATNLANGGSNPANNTTSQAALALLLANASVTALVKITNNDTYSPRHLTAVAMTSLAGGAVSSASTVQAVVNALNANTSFDDLAVASTNVSYGSRTAQPQSIVTLSGGVTGQWTLDYNFTRAVSVNADGNLAYLDVNSSTPVVMAVKAGVLYPIAVKGIRSTSTTATGIVGHI